MSVKTDLIEQRYSKLQELRQRGYEPYPYRYALRQTVSQLVQGHGSSTAEELERTRVEVRTAGRIMALRGHGKAGFLDLSDARHRIQVYVKKDLVGEEVFDLYQLLDLGDIIGIKGHLFRTRTGELTVSASRLEFLSKALLPLPEKWHGLTDVEIRYRQRYLDLIANPEVREIFVRRSRIISELRKFLEAREYLEVETPMMQPVAGGATARPFKTFHEALDIPLYLRIAPELYLKRLVVGGFHRVFEINRNFRNEGISRQHNPEFTMLEFYQAFSDYADLMDLTEEMLRTVVENVLGALEVEYRGQKIDFNRFTRFTLVDAVRHFWRGEPPLTRETLEDRSRVAELLDRMGVEFKNHESWGKLLGLLFEQVVERHLVQPTFIYDFPLELSPLSKKKRDDPRYAERFELFVGGLEIANAYSELNDPEEQKRRFEEQLRARVGGDLEAHEMDEDYLRALRYGMPPTAGEGIGIDRLVMILTDSASIREVILFPQLRPEEGRAGASEDEGS